MNAAKASRFQFPVEGSNQGGRLGCLLMKKATAYPTNSSNNNMKNLDSVNLTTKGCGFTARDGSLVASTAPQS